MTKVAYHHLPPFASPRKSLTAGLLSLALMACAPTADYSNLAAQDSDGGKKKTVTVTSPKKKEVKVETDGKKITISNGKETREFIVKDGDGPIFIRDGKIVFKNKAGKLIEFEDEKGKVVEFKAQDGNSFFELRNGRMIAGDSDDVLEIHVGGLVEGLAGMAEGLAALDEDYDFDFNFQFDDDAKGNLYFNMEEYSEAEKKGRKMAAEELGKTIETLKKQMEASENKIEKQALKSAIRGMEKSKRELESNRAGITEVAKLMRINAQRNHMRSEVRRAMRHEMEDGLREIKEQQRELSRMSKELSREMRNARRDVERELRDLEREFGSDTNIEEMKDKIRSEAEKELADLEKRHLKALKKAEQQLQKAQKRLEARLAERKKELKDEK